MYTYSASDFLLPDQDNLIHFDAYWYYTIKEYGYKYEPNTGNSLAFFPLFPLVWRFSTLSEVSICIFNYALFIFSFVFLLKDEKLHSNILLLLLSFPSFIFFSLPYSESFFFLFSAFIILGYKKNSNVLLCIGFFGASLVRSVCVIFVPAIILCELLNLDSGKSKKQRIAQVLLRLIYSISGLLVAMIYVYYKTGTWFYFIEIQKYWNRHWLMPRFPLTTYSAKRVLGLDGIVFMLGLFAIYFGFKAALLWKKKQTKSSGSSNSIANSTVLFSALYMAGMTILDTFFTFYKNGSTCIWSLNRHVICTPFSIIFIIYLIRDFRPNLYESITIVFLIFLGVFITGIYRYANVPVLGFYACYFSTFCLLKIKSFFHLNKFFILYYAIALYLQVQFFNDFLCGRWVG